MRRRNKNGTKFTIPSNYLLLILTILCVVTMVVTFTTDIFVGTLSSVSGYVIVPFQEGVSAVGTWITDRSDELVQIRDVLAENKKLQEQLDELIIENNILQQERYELNNLRELYQLDQQYDDYEKVGARIISRDGGNWFHSFIIDKGSNDGINIDMNVLAGSGLVGRVVDIGPNWAKVTSIIDDNSNVSAMILSTEDQLIVSGSLELMSSGVISFSKLIDVDEKVVEGDKIVTSHISPKYLPGILIGYISELNTDANNITKSGSVTPAVDFEHLKEVLVILDLKQSVE